MSFGEVLTQLAFAAFQQSVLKADIDTLRERLSFGFASEFDRVRLDSLERLRRTTLQRSVDAVLDKVRRDRTVARLAEARERMRESSERLLGTHLETKARTLRPDAGGTKE
jgi:hypothetical protein